MNDKYGYLSSNGGPAFPGIYERCGEYSGMTLRDYFAAKAMQGWISCGARAVNTREKIAEESYKIADAMLLARESKPDITKDQGEL